jgi:hypothetical protein
MGDDETSQGATSQETAQTYSTMSDWLGDYWVNCLLLRAVAYRVHFRTCS